MSQVVDTETASEFMKEALERISPEDLDAILHDVEHKSDRFRETFDRSKLKSLTREELQDTFKTIFSVRRAAGKIVDDYTPENLGIWIDHLLYGEAPVPERFQTFCDHLEGLEESVRFDLAGELLHFTFPDKLWPWHRWMWNPKTKTGSLPLVVTEDYDLSGTDLGDAYMKVGKAIAFVHNVGEAAGFQTISRSLFGTDVFLSCVYVVYVYTVLRIRMTQEFNKVMPGLPEFSRRLLGVYQLEV